MMVVGGGVNRKMDTLLIYEFGVYSKYLYKKREM